MEVKILGKTYVVKSDLDDKFTHETADLVDRKIRELLSKLGPVSSERVAILAALNFAGELLQIKRKGKERDLTLRKKISKISDMLDKHHKKNG